MREYKRGRTGLENVDGILLGRTAMASPMVPTPYIVEERPKKKLHAQNIKREIAEATTVF